MPITARAQRRLRALGRATEKTSCNVERALGVLGAKWSLVILHDLIEGPKRFGELQRLIPAASPKMLTERLRELEAHGLLTRTVHPEIPPRVEYALTDTGETVWPILDALDKWGERLQPRR